MPRNLRWKAVLILLAILICAYGIFGLPTSKEELVSNLKQNIRLGLDLKGGSHLVLQVQLQDAFKAEADAVIDRLRDEVAKVGITGATIDRNDPQTFAEAKSIQITVRGVPAERSTALRSIVSEQFTRWSLKQTNSKDYTLELKPAEAVELARNLVEQSRTTIESRINALGLTEPVVQLRGRSEDAAEILVQLPGEDDPARVRNIIQTAAVLEFFEVKDGPFASPEEARAKHGGVLPLNTKLLRQMPRGGDSNRQWFLLARTPVIRGMDLRDARPQQDSISGAWETSFVLSQEAKDRFGRFTESNVGNRLAIVLDNQVYSAPRIDSRIEDNGRITGAGSQQEAADLALVLRSGALPASVVSLEERTVGPSLGADSIRQGFVAGGVGLALVVAFMLFYYKWSAINATIALILNAIILIGALAYFGAVLTLPGIAGIILLIGMAVDSNVLVFERIRDELRGGKSVLSAIQTGFNKAFLTIVDTHITTVVSCLFLFRFGSGPVKGFAVTLVIGLIANVFTAVFVSKFIFDWEMSRRRQPATLSI
jgi:preprotein translocase subunit SecD